MNFNLKKSALLAAKAQILKHNESSLKPFYGFLVSTKSGQLSNIPHGKTVIFSSDYLESSVQGLQKLFHMTSSYLTASSITGMYVLHKLLPLSVNKKEKHSLMQLNGSAFSNLRVFSCNKISGNIVL